MFVTPPSAIDLVYGFTQTHLSDLINPQWVQKNPNIAWKFDRDASGALVPPADIDNPMLSFSGQAHVIRNPSPDQQTVIIDNDASGGVEIRLNFFAAIFTDNTSGTPQTFYFAGATDPNPSEPGNFTNDVSLTVSIKATIQDAAVATPPDFVVQSLSSALGPNNWPHQVTVHCLCSVATGSAPLSVATPGDFIAANPTEAADLAAGMTAWMSSQQGSTGFNPLNFPFFYYILRNPDQSAIIHKTLIPTASAFQTLPSGMINGETVPPGLCVAFAVYQSQFALPNPISKAISDTGALFSLKPYGQSTVINGSTAPVLAVSPLAAATFFTQGVAASGQITSYLNTRMAVIDGPGTNWDLQSVKVADAVLTPCDPSAPGKNGCCLSYNSGSYDTSQSGTFSNVSFWDQVFITAGWQQRADGSIVMATTMGHQFQGSSTSGDDNFIQMSQPDHGELIWSYQFSAGGTNETPALITAITKDATASIPAQTTVESDASDFIQQFFNYSPVASFVSTYNIYAASNISTVVVFAIDGVTIEEPTLDADYRLNFQLTTVINDPIAL